MERRFVLLSDTIPERPAELRPIPCPHCQGQQQGKRSTSLKKYSAIHVQGEAPESDDSSRDCEAKRVYLSFLAGAYSTRQSSEEEPLLALKVIGIFQVSKKVLWSPVMAGETLSLSVLERPMVEPATQSTLVDRVRQTLAGLQEPAPLNGKVVRGKADAEVEFGNTVCTPAMTLSWSYNSDRKDWRPADP